jgi:D-alanyl-D-alanine carboxypeptidase
MNINPRIASGAAAALLALGTTTSIWLEPKSDDHSLAQYQARCNTLFSSVIVESAKHGIYYKALEAYRTSAQAKIYAAQGKGIANSVHTKSLAWDMARVMPDGTVSFKPVDYEFTGKVWKEAGRKVGLKTRWGGDFIRNPDYVHFSCELDGIR